MTTKDTPPPSVSLDIESAVNAWLTTGSLPPNVVALLRNRVVEELQGNPSWKKGKVQAAKAAYCVALGLSPYTTEAQVAAALLDRIDRDRDGCSYLFELETQMQAAGCLVLSVQPGVLPRWKVQP